MQWCCFLFWFVYRLVLACLAHFNWCMALYTNCVYFCLWKSYDLLWFWMHLTLCSCFPQLRRENYLIVWCNLIWKRRTQYPHLTYKQLYLALYGAKGTKAERALQRMDTIETKERESRRLRRITETEGSSSSDEEDEAIDSLATAQSPRNGSSRPDDILAEEEEECRKYVYVGQAVDSQKDLESRNEDLDPSPVPPPRAARHKADVKDDASAAAATAVSNCQSVNFNLKETIAEQDEDVENGDGSGEDSDTNSTSKWIQKVPNVIRNKFRFGRTAPSTSTATTPSSGAASSSGNQLSVNGDANDQDNVSMTTWTSKLRGMIPNPLKFNRSVSNDANPNELDVLRPDYSNTYDIKDPKKAEKRTKHDRKVLTARLRKQRREELKEEARKERKRRMVTDAIELMLQLLRMMASFAILVGNIRKTFIPAQFKYLKPGQHAYDNYELLLLFRVTTFLDVSMFWTNIMWVYCLQWHLCCRLGVVRFWSWAALLALIAITVVFMPMGYAMGQMDLSWCRFMPNTTLEKYQPKW